ncbi:MAG: WGR domain-containing protein [Gemmataceae bacterium]|nr:WGR domain-containing protein [Gemmataceae bacterium]
MATVKAWKFGDNSAPAFPDDFEIVRKAVLQVTDIKSNHNKYYAIELHSAKHKGEVVYRVFTHYGRTDDLETNPDAGQKECRFFDAQGEAEANYQSIYREKTAPRKGYQEVALASSKIGSQKARGTSSGAVDDKTLERIKKPETAAPKPKASTLHPGVQALVRYLYDEATNALTSSVAAKITANGIETPLGILTVGQIEKGEAILGDLYDLFKQKASSRRDQRMVDLTGQFYTSIPHRIGRTRSAVDNAIINTLETLYQKQETLQLMKDMLSVNGESGSVLFDAQADSEYNALKCQIGCIDPAAPKYRELADFVIKSQVKSKNIQVKNIYTLRREDEWGQFEDVGNQQLLFHGSRIQNWVGLLSRGILLPKIVVSMGVRRTDAGWLGNGIYFGDAACTSAFYTTPGRKQTRLMAIARVALGKVKDFTKITYGLPGPPDGFHSCHGVRQKTGVASEFQDDEWVIYRPQQQRLEYLVEFAA